MLGLPAPGVLPIGAAPPMEPLEPVPLGEGVEPVALEGAVLLVEPELIPELEPLRISDEPALELEEGELAPELELLPDDLPKPEPVVPQAVSTSAQARGMVHFIITFSF